MQIYTKCIQLSLENLFNMKFNNNKIVNNNNTIKLYV